MQSSQEETRKAYELSTDGEIFDPFQGLLDLHKESRKNLRYGFQLDGNNYLLPEFIHSEVIQDFNICELPNTKEFIIGIINLRGNLVPVFNLQKIPHQSVEREKYLLVIGDGEEVAAIPIDHLPMAIDFDDIEILERQTRVVDLPEHLREYCRGLFSKENMTWYEMDFSRIFKSMTRMYHE